MPSRRPEIHALIAALLWAPLGCRQAPLAEPAPEPRVVSVALVVDGVAAGAVEAPASGRQSLASVLPEEAPGPATWRTVRGTGGGRELSVDVAAYRAYDLALYTAPQGPALGLFRAGSTAAAGSAPVRAVVGVDRIDIVTVGGGAVAAAAPAPEIHLDVVVHGASQPLDRATLDALPHTSWRAGRQRTDDEGTTLAAVAAHFGVPTASRVIVRDETGTQTLDSPDLQRLLLREESGLINMKQVDPTSGATVRRFKRVTQIEIVDLAGVDPPQPP